MALDGHRVVRDPLQLKFGLERFAGVRDGRERWLSIRRETLRDDLIIHKLDQQLLNEAALAKLVGRMPPYVTARYTR
ncbi:MAG: hypothetical protein GY789_09510 [Hyphomicrobiales bacterium]|nr:hypothetical protein [Hyphomicrobiales bacterium]MCP4998652.1 hypothetical protein [Hyphomicrobiales bacterium]